eukprot:6196535-Pleurochrysis_carterae.AAC.2
MGSGSAGKPVYRGLRRQAIQFAQTSNTVCCACCVWRSQRAEGERTARLRSIAAQPADPESATRGEARPILLVILHAICSRGLHSSARSLTKPAIRLFEYIQLRILVISLPYLHK